MQNRRAVTWHELSQLLPGQLWNELRRKCRMDQAFIIQGTLMKTPAFWGSCLYALKYISAFQIFVWVMTYQNLQSFFSKQRQHRSQCGKCGCTCAASKPAAVKSSKLPGNASCVKLSCSSPDLHFLIHSRFCLANSSRFEDLKVYVRLQWYF